jgi:hypothetical protein
MELADLFDGEAARRERLQDRLRRVATTENNEQSFGASSPPIVANVTEFLATEILL